MNGRRLMLALFLGAALLSAPADARFSQKCRIGILCGSGPALLDLVPGTTAAYSLRCLRQAYCATGNAINIRRASDNAQQNIGFVGVNLNTTLVSSFCASTTCYVSTFYDQSGNGNNTAQPTAASQPQLVLSASPNGRPALFANGSQYLQTVGAVSFVPPISVAGVGVYSGVSGDQPLTSVGGSNNDFLGWSSPAVVLWQTGSDGVGASASASAWHAILGTSPASGTTVNHVYVDGTITAGSSTTHASVNSNIYIANSAAGRLIGYVGEVIFWPAELTTAQAALVHLNERAFWGTP